jgi:predicted MFS family arabinose efflux permease
MTKPRQATTVLRFVVLIGVVNLFADLTYEGARSVTGPFLAQLGATAAVISIVSGAGEFVGYTLRAIAGYVADKTGRYWTLVTVGYAVNMLAVPALSLAGNWPAAACLMAAERTGRAIRRPIVQGMLSHAKADVGGGRAFGINESLDALGATVGPLVMAGVVAWRGNYRDGFAMLLISALLCLGMLVLTRRQYPQPQSFEHAGQETSGDLPSSYWIYLAAGAFIGFGFVDFSLIAFHLQKTGTLQRDMIPISYGVAMGTGAIGNWVLGSLYDRLGLPLLMGAFLFGAFFTPLVFFGTPAVAVVGMALWGLNKGAQDTLLKPAIAPLIPAARRSTAFGIFDTGFGVAWLAGSIAFGLLYDQSLHALVTVSVVAQLLSLPLFVLGHRAGRHSRG